MKQVRTIVVVSILVLAVLVVLIVKIASLSSATSSQKKEFTRTAAALQDSLQKLNGELDSLEKQMPGLGEYMTTMQLHMAKLWFAAQAANWELANYELGELQETIEGAEALHAFKNKVDISSVLQSVRQAQTVLLGQAISERSIHNFMTAYDQTLAACNGCHRPAGYGFVHIVKPLAPPVTNQQWKVAR
ncbi:MAG: hypothetical protein WBW16_06040 [Bacteroidota bacterium]